MASRDELADILGGPILQRPESGLFATFSRYHFVFKFILLLGLGLVVWIMCARGLEHLRKRREFSCRKAMRRQHGIPDSDCRPFAVAYAAAKRAHLEREAQDRKKMTNYASDHNLPAVDQRTDAQKDARGLRRRAPENAVQPHDNQLHGKRTAVYDDKRSESRSLDFVDRYNPNPRYRMTMPEPSTVPRHPIHRATRRSLVMDLDNNDESRKRTFESESDVEYEIMKKSRIDQDELRSEAERAGGAQFGEVSRRASKGTTLGRRREGHSVYTNGHERYERVDGFQDGCHELIDEAMEGIEEDGEVEFKAAARGKKRDRAEAGSSDEDEDLRNGRISHHRKRRSVLQRKAEVLARGQKRDREAESEGEGDEGDSETSRRRVQRRSKKKTGKKAASNETGETSVEDPHISKDPLCGGRRVGDEWETDDVRYKVGGKGERLRLALVKRSKNKYRMPQDSQHPDRSAALEIYVETWMTDAQYKDAEERQELAWQEAPRERSGSKTPDVVEPPMKNGKELLWDSVSGSPARRPLREFMPSSALTRINPFEQSQPTLGRRVASSSAIASPIFPGVADSPARPGFRGFSKWEKQDREADALARIRARIGDPKKTQAPQKSVEIPPSASAPELGTKPLSIPTITLTPAPAVAAEGNGNTISIPQGKPSLTVPLTAPPSINDSIKGAAAAATTVFSLPSTSIPTITPSTFLPSAPTAPTATSSTLSSSFSFGKPLQAPLPTSTTTSSVAPKPFEKGPGGALFTSSPSVQGAADEPQPPSTESVSKPQISSFAKPVTFSLAPPAAAATPSTTKPQASGVSAPSPSPAIFAPAVANAEALAPPPAPASATPSGNSKPTIPLFSFSNTPSSTATLQPPTAPKFSFGQPSATSMFKTTSIASGAASQAQPGFKFGQTPPSAKDGHSPSVVPVADEVKKSTSVFGAATGSNGPFKSPFEIPSSSGSSKLTSTSVTGFFTKPTAVDDSTSTSPKPTSISASATVANNTAAIGTPSSGNTTVFTFGGVDSFKPGEGSKPASLFGGSSPIFGANSAEKKPTFSFAAPADGSKPISIFGSSTEGLQPPLFGGSAESSARSRGGL